MAHPQIDDARSRPERYINCFRLTLERGDGECIDLGEMPDLGNPVSVSAFIVKLSQARERCGRYDPYDSDWSPKQLDFRVESDFK